MDTNTGNENPAPMVEIEARIRAHTPPSSYSTMKPTTAIYELGDNQFGQPIRLMFSGNSVIIKQEAYNQRDSSAEITLSRKQFERICDNQPAPDLE